MTRHEPEPLELGACEQCGEPIVIHMQKGVPRKLYEDEKFCSAVCCRAYHGTTISTGTPKRPTAT